MAGLEKFYNDSWRARFKKVILAERKITPITEPVKESQRFSLDISEDLTVILEEKKISRLCFAHNKTDKMIEPKDKENITSNCRNSDLSIDAHHNRSKQTNSNALNAYEDSLLVEKDESQWQRTSDESFEAIEKMCDKTASDPDSTLFRYLNSDQKEEIVDSVKQRSRSCTDEPFNTVYDAEAKALKRLLDELRLEEQIQLENESPLKGGDLTSLEDIEAPSRLWENTITSETMLKTSPVKMVGLLRPSTIIEENDCEDVSYSEISSHVSYQSLFKAAASEVSTSCYETANDSATISKTAKPVNHYINQFNAFTAPLVESVSDELTDLAGSVNLIDLDKIDSPTQCSILDIKCSQYEADKNDTDQVICDSGKEMESSGSEDSIIEILSDEHTDVDEGNISVEDKCKKIYTVDSKLQKASNISCQIAKLAAIDSNMPASPKVDYLSDVGINLKTLSDLEKSPEKSIHFNDTMEEVEYMMKKGLQYLAAAANTPATESVVAKSSSFNIKQNWLSPKSKDRRHRSPSPICHRQNPMLPTSYGNAKHVKSTTKSSEKVLEKPKPVNSCSLNIKPFPKLDIFKKPKVSTAISSSANLRHKDSTNKQFAHIVSPIRAYIKKTNNTPLMLTINDVDRHPNSLSSMRELEKENRLYNSDLCGTPPNPIKSTGPSSLPKKAYISSEFKQFVDERTPVTIPGGKQYQKHIEAAMLPAVLKHEGKMKYPGFMASNRMDENTPNNAATTPHVSRLTDASVADLSVMYGDISMYTIKDARKF